MAGTGDKLLTAAEIKEVTDTKVDKDFSALTALPNGLSDTDLINVRRSGTNYKLSGSDLAPTPLVASITTGQWSGSGSDYYITVTASNVTANSILVPTYDHTSDSRLKGPVWCVPAAGSFTIHTSAIPTGTVTVMVQFIGTLGEAQYQVLADVYSKSQTDALIAQSTANLAPCKILTSSTKTTHVINLEASSRHLIVALSGSASNSFCVTVSVSSGGTVTILELGKGNNVTLTTAANTLTCTLSTSNGMYVADFAIAGNFVTLS